MNFELKNYPLLYRESDALAANAQKKHFIFVRIKILLFLLTGGLMSVNIPIEAAMWTSVTIFIALLLILSLALTAILNVKNYDKVWFSSRRIAESVKAETWRFMMKVEPYNHNITDHEAENRFLEFLKKILHSHEPLCCQLTQDSLENVYITEQMRMMRNEDLQNRKNYYIQNRIKDQRLWYLKKAKWNSDQESKWLMITWVLEFAAVMSAIFLLLCKTSIINPVGIFTTAVGGCLSWLNARSYREPAESYGLMAQELALFEEQAKRISSEQELVKIVTDVEAAINREQSTWLGRPL